MSKYEKDNLVIVVLVSLLFIISATLMYFVYFNKPVVVDNKESIFVKVTDEKIINDLTNTILDNNLVLLSKNGKNVDNINAISNADKLEMAYETLNNENTKVDGITEKEIDKYFKDNFDTTIYWNKDNIKCSCDSDIYIYNTELNKYEYSENHEEHDINKIVPYYSKVIGVEKKNDIYVIKISHVWGISNNKYINSGYTSYENVVKDMKLFEIEVPEEIENEDLKYYAIKEMNDNYEDYKDRLRTYTYTFINKDGKYLLQSFKYEK